VFGVHGLGLWLRFLNYGNFFLSLDIYYGLEKLYYRYTKDIYHKTIKYKKKFIPIFITICSLLAYKQYWLGLVILKDI
jgi:hypothetical protein